MIKNPPIIKKIIKKMGGMVKEIIPERGIFQVNIKGAEFLMARKFSLAKNPLLGRETTKFKDLTYFLLKKHSLPTPETVCFYKKSFDLKKAKRKLELFKYPIIIKDAEGSNSQGIFANIKTVSKGLTILKKEIGRFPRLIAQEMVFGKEYRVLVLNNKAIAALELIPPRIFGDGKNSVKKLINIKQRHTEKKTPLDFNLKNILRDQGFSLQSIPERGSIINIRKNSSLAEGGETQDVTHAIHGDIEKICIEAADVVGKYLVGIDVICEDISKSLRKQAFNILEINGKPDIYIHYNPSHGKTRDVVKKIVNFILKMKPF